MEHREHLHMIPGHMHAAILRWIERGEPHPSLLGNFLRAVLSNDLRESVARADEDNRAALVSWVRYLYNYAPGPCWGSVEALDAWYHAHHPQEKSVDA